MHSVDDIILGLTCRVPCQKCPYSVDNGKHCNGDLASSEAVKILEEYRDLKQATTQAVKYYQDRGHEYKYSIGYFYYDTHEPCWELKFVGDRFKDILDGDCVAIFKMLRSAYDALEEWVRSRDEDLE